MEKAEYELYQLNEEPNYIELCNLFINSSKTPEERKVYEQILYDGNYNGFYFSSGKCNAGSPFIEATRRLSMASLFKTNPDSFYQIVEGKINLFHGTNGNALPSIIKYGLTSGKSVVENGLELVTGEESTRMNRLRNFTSFTDVLDIAKSYAGLRPLKNKENLDFEVVLCTTVEEAQKSRFKVIESSIVEVGVRNTVPLSSIKALIVPEDKVKYVKKLLPNTDIKVLGVKSFDYKYYYVGDYDIEQILYNDFNEPVQEQNKGINKDEVKQLSSTRLLSRIRDKISKFLNIKGDASYEGFTK